MIKRASLLAKPRYLQVNTVSQSNVDPVTGRLFPKAPATAATGTQPTGIAVATSPLSSRAKLAFASKRDGDSEIYSMNENGTADRRLTTNPAPDSEPSWSPDGSKIAFTSKRIDSRAF